jgi:predicted nucleic acid-binding protein
MARTSYLVDTDILIDWLRGQLWVRKLILSDDVRLYCSAVTRKELLSRPGLKDSERRRILRLLTSRILLSPKSSPMCPACGGRPPSSCR